jgi:hypothetical protein
MQVTLAGAAAVGALALFNAAQPGGAENASAAGQAPASSSVLQTAPTASGGNVIAVDNTDPSSGDTFTQNAQDQSTA